MPRFEAPDVVDFLRRAAAPAGAPVNVVSTHISHVVIGPAVVFKLKRPVRLGYVDFSTADRRLATCRTEVALNRRTDPRGLIYRDVRTITRKADGSLEFDGDGPLVDAVVRMHPFDQSTLLDHLAAKGPLSRASIEALAAAIGALHRQAPVLRDGGGAARIGRVLDINRDAFLGNRSWDTAQVSALDRRFRAALTRHAAALDRRATEGWVRRGHGDLHLGNICLIDGEPLIFDCLEFDEDLGTTDVLYDLAFVVMDLWHRGRRPEANLLFNRYCDATGDTADLSLLPFFVAIRAAVRAHVMAGRADTSAASERPQVLAEAKSYLALANTALAPREALLVAVGGLSGSGKSSLAALVAPALAPIPGARIINSDRLRKTHFGVGPEARLGAEAYRPDVSDTIYAALREAATATIRQGHSVVVDAVHARESERLAIEEVARACGRPFLGLWLDGPATLLKSRVAARRGGPSDAVVATVDAQFGYDLGALRWARLDAARALDDIGAEALALISAMAPVTPIL